MMSNQNVIMPRGPQMKNIIFDLGQVLINWNPDRVYDAYFKDKHKTRQFYEETGIFLLNKEMDKGLSFDEGLTLLSSKFPHYEEPIHLWKNKWTEMIGGEIEGSVEILKQLSHLNYPLYAITNWSAETFPYVHGKYEFFQYFRDIVISGKENVIKPDPLIYELLLRRNQLEPADCIFIDDVDENVEGAKKVGMDAVKFEGPEKLLADLKLRDVL